MEPFSLTTILITFAGGVVGTALGALLAFVLCAGLVMAGCCVVMAGGSDFLLLQVGLGPIFGPHVGGFAAGVAAACYAVGVKKNHPSNDAKDIVSPLVDTSWDVLLVGGLTSIFGHITFQLLSLIPILNQCDVLAFTVFLSAVLARVLFLKEMPWGRGESIAKYGYLGTDGYKISWAGYMSPPGTLAVIGLGVGLLSGSFAMGTQMLLAPLAEAGKISAAAAFVAPLIIGWSLSSLGLSAIMFGSGNVQKVPITHCPAVLGALSFLLSGSIIASGIVGILAMFLQELMARLFYNHGSSHIDPPAGAIWAGTFLINILYKADFFNFVRFFS